MIRFIFDTLRPLLLVYAILFVSFAFLLPVIYMKSQVYYISRDISKLTLDYEILLAQNLELKQKIEKLNFSLID